MRANGSTPGSPERTSTTDPAAEARASRTTNTASDPHANDAAAARGLPSMVWRYGQDRRFAMIRDVVNLDGACALDLGCGVGMYTSRMAADGATAIGLEIEWPRAVEARERGLNVVAAVGERLPVADEALDVVLLHEVLEHVADDRETIAEAMRALRPGGRVLIFVPNRWWPFETHGIQWRGRYHFGNKPFVNYLPDVLRNRLAPHVRVYTGHGLRDLFAGLPCHVVHHTRIYPGFDKLATRRPRLAGVLRRVLYGLERTPLRVFGLSHLLVVERDAVDAPEAAPFEHV